MSYQIATRSSPDGYYIAQGAVPSAPGAALLKIALIAGALWFFFGRKKIRQNPRGAPTRTERALPAHLPRRRQQSTRKIRQLYGAKTRRRSRKKGRTGRWGDIDRYARDEALPRLYEWPRDPRMPRQNGRPLTQEERDAYARERAELAAFYRRRTKTRREKYRQRRHRSYESYQGGRSN